MRSNLVFLVLIAFIASPFAFAQDQAAPAGANQERAPQSAKKKHKHKHHKGHHGHRGSRK